MGIVCHPVICSSARSFVPSAMPRWKSLIAMTGAPDVARAYGGARLSLCNQAFSSFNGN